MRPPYGYHDQLLDAQLADLGYPAVTMWLGDLGDSTVRKPRAIVANAKRWLLPGHVVIGHANHLPVTKVYGQLVEIIVLSVQFLMTNFLTNVADTEIDFPEFDPAQAG